MNAKLTALAFALAVGDNKAAESLQVGRMQAFVDFARQASDDDVAAFLKGPKGTDAESHPGVVEMVKAGMKLKTATVRLSQTRTLWSAHRSGLSLWDDKGKAAFGWNSGVLEATDYKKGVRAANAERAAATERAALVGEKLAAEIARGRKAADVIDGIINTVDDTLAARAAEDERAALVRKASNAAHAAGMILFPNAERKMTPRARAAELIAAYGPKLAEKIADAVRDLLLEAERDANKGKGAKPEPMPAAPAQAEPATEKAA